MDEIGLYYPYVAPPESWVRSSLFLFDKMTSIVPREPALWQGDQTLHLLHEEGLWDPSHADNAYEFENYTSDVEEVLLAYAVNTNYKVHGVALGGPYASLYMGKLASFVTDSLVELDLATPLGAQRLLVHEEVAAMLLAVTARHVVDNRRLRQHERIVTSTDSSMSRAYAYDPVPRTVGRHECAEVLLRDSIPTPGPDVPLGAIIEFRLRHQHELHRLRIEIDNIVDAIMNSEDPVDKMIRCKRDFDGAVDDLARAANARRISIGATSIAVLGGGAAAKIGLSVDDLNLLFQGVGGGIAVYALQHLVRRRPRTAGDPLDYLVRARAKFG